MSFFHAHSLSLTLTLAGTLAAGPVFGQAADAPPVSVAVPPADVADPPADADLTASGLASKVLTPGSGSVMPDALDVVTVHYTGWTSAGNLLDSSVLRGTPSVFSLDGIMPGLSESLQLMVEGEQRRVWIPAALAYEGTPDRWQGPVTFNLELIDILPMPTPPPDVAAPPSDAQRTSSGLSTRVLEAGRGSDHPNERSTVTVHYSGWTTDGEMFDSSVSRGQPATFRLDEVIPGWTEGLQLMAEGEKRRLWIPESLAYKGAAGAPRGTLVFDVMLIAIAP
jgi:peptidylprolyl isomerase